MQHASSISSINVTHSVYKWQKGRLANGFGSKREIQVSVRLLTRKHFFSLFLIFLINYRMIKYDYYDHTNNLSKTII
ncbi:hypothetical protein Hanom_Chr15g01411741 [Helianthus anomalus]